MKIYDVSSVEYRIILLLPDGSTRNITDLIGGANLSVSTELYSAVLTIRSKNVKMSDGWMHSNIYLGRRVLVEAKDATRGWQEIFRGIFNDWQTVAHDKTMEATAYDTNYPMVQSEEHFFFKQGETGKSRILRMCKALGIPYGRIDGPNVSLSKEMHIGTIAQGFTNALKSSYDKDGKKYYIRTNKGKLEIVGKGTNKEVYEIDSFGSDSGYDKHSLDSDFTTVVKIYGNKNEKKVPPVSAVVRGNTQYGSIQKILFKSDFKNVSEAKAAANAIIKEQGKPKKEQTVGHPDIPWVGLGDKLMVMVGTVGSMKDGKQIPVPRYVKAITRDLTKGQMTLTLEV